MQHVTCDYCQHPALLVTGKDLYPHRPDLWEKKFYRCVPCDAHVGCHPAANAPGGGVGDGTVPMGRLANPELRRAKSAAHAAFDPLWQSGRMRRREAYAWLAQVLQLPSGEAHIGMFDVAQCLAVVAAVRALLTVSARPAVSRLQINTMPGRRTGPKKAPADCGCDALPWDHCIHTRSQPA